MMNPNLSGTTAVEHDSGQTRFVVRQEGDTAWLAYNIIGSQMILEYTELPAAMKGRGVAAALARAALEYARANGLMVLPVCPFVIGYLARHPEFHDLLKNPRFEMGKDDT